MQSRPLAYTSVIMEKSMDRQRSLTVKELIPKPIYSNISKIRRMSTSIFHNFGGIHKRECPVCKYKGYFTGRGAPLRFDAVCRSCGSLERHRQHFLLVCKNPSWIDGARLLHFGAEPCFVPEYSERTSLYVRADLFAGPGETRVDIQKMQFADDSFDTIICHQIMEHIPDDQAAMRELFRVICPNGVVIFSTPIVHNWDKTYTNPSVTTDAERDLHFGQRDHLRVYGRDFRSLIERVGFDVSENIAFEPDVSRYGLVRGDIIYIAKKPETSPFPSVGVPTELPAVVPRAAIGEVLDGLAVQPTTMLVPALETPEGDRD